MAKAVIGLFDDVAEARGVIRELVDAGFERNDISLVANNVGGDRLANEGAGGMRAPRKRNGTMLVTFPRAGGGPAELRRKWQRSLRELGDAYDRP